MRGTATISTTRSFMCSTFRWPGTALTKAFQNLLPPPPPPLWLVCPSETKTTMVNQKIQDFQGRSAANDHGRQREAQEERSVLLEGGAEAALHALPRRSLPGKLLPLLSAVAVAVRALKTRRRGNLTSM